MNMENKETKIPQEQITRNFDKELREMQSKITHPAVIKNNPKKEEFTYYTDKRKTILTSNTFAIS